MKSVFVTGGTGFLGAYLLHYLVQKGYRIRALRRSNSRMDLVEEIADKIEWVEGDILDGSLIEESLKGIAQIYHAAAMVSFSPAKAEQMLKTNIDGTSNIVNAALHLGTVEKLVHVSSIAALGSKENQLLVTEDTGWENNKHNSNYAISKFKSECEVWRGMQEGLNVAVVNPSVILGAGYWKGGTSSFFSRVYKGMKICPTGATGYVDVRDVAQACIALMESEISGQRYILNAENLDYQQLFEIIAKALNKDAPKRKLTKSLGALLWRLDWLRSKLLGKSPSLTRELVYSASQRHHYSNDKFIKDFGFQFRPIETSIKETADLFLKGLKNKKLYALLSL